MSHALLNVEFYHNNSNILFPKKVSVCGFLNSPTKIMTLEVVYPYCQESIDEDDDIEMDNDYGDDNCYRCADECNIYKIKPKRKLKFGNLCVQGINETLSKTLSKFDTIIVDDDILKQFSNQHFPDKTVLLLEKNKYNK